MTDLTAHYASAERGMSRTRLWILGIPLLILGYLAYVFVSFDVAQMMREADTQNARILVSDMVTHKVHVARDNTSGEIEIAVEGERKGRYPPEKTPEWVALEDGQTVVQLEDGYSVRLIGEGETEFDVPGYGTILLIASRTDGVQAIWPDGTAPEWANVGSRRIAMTTPAGRVNVTVSKTEVLRYFAGWELFFFTLDSPFHGDGPLTLLQKAFSGEAGAIWNGFWFNDMWRHAEVLWAIFETILMAFLGTAGAAMIALPISFAAARNFTPFGPLRQVVRRVFDFLRGVDGLIWTVILSRAYGPGPMTGALAMIFTDTGSFGKLFSEALENVDDKQVEGVRSTGADALARARFGVLPQLVPVLLSQILYYLESNTRSATVIGAITGGGIGLLLTQAIITQKDWEEVTYYIVLIVLMVFLMDSVSGWLRRKLIKGE